MRILQLISSGGMYGAEAVILNLMREWNGTAAHECVLAVFHHPEQPRPALYEAALQAGIEPHLVHLLPCRGQLDMGVSARLRELGEGADVLHAHGYKADIYAAFAWNGPRPALVSTCHTWYDNDLAVRVYGALDRWVLRRYDGVVAVSAEVRDRLLSAKVAATRVRLVRNGVRMESFAAAGRRRQDRSTEGVPLRIGLVGRLAPEKGVDIFLRAAALLLKEHPRLLFTVAGEGPERPSLESLLQELDLSQNVRLAGNQKDMLEFYAGLDILVSASRQEGLPIALLEGTASGLPVVATRVGAVDAIVVPEVTGLLVAPDSPDALAMALARLVGSPEQRAAFGLAGQRRTAEKFSAARMAEEYLDVYREALMVRAGGGFGGGSGSGDGERTGQVEQPQHG